MTAPAVVATFLCTWLFAWLLSLLGMRFVGRGSA